MLATRPCFRRVKIALRGHFRMKMELSLRSGACPHGRGAALSHQVLFLECAGAPVREWCSFQHGCTDGAPVREWCPFAAWLHGRRSGARVAHLKMHRALWCESGVPFQHGCTDGAPVREWRTQKCTGRSGARVAFSASVSECRCSLLDGVCTKAHGLIWPSRSTLEFRKNPKGFIRPVRSM